MSDFSRRKFLRLTATAPLAASVLGTNALAETGKSLAPITGTTAAAPKTVRSFAPMTQQVARKRIQEQHLPNLSMFTHEGKRVLFYDDLVKNKVVTLNFFYTHCDEVCPLVTANLVKVQKLLGAQVGRDIHMYSFTLKPEEDSVDVIRNYRKKFGAGWTFLTAAPKDMEKLRVAIGFTYPDPAIDKDTTQHIGNVRYGNEPLMYWSACPGMAHAEFVAETLQWIIHPR
ncbi:MAG TPA: SCO family protein [Candidatus Acidoferrum sp.]